MSPKVQRNPTEHRDFWLPQGGGREKFFLPPPSPQGETTGIAARPDQPARDRAVIGVVAIGLRILPHPLDVLTAFLLPTVYFLARMYPSLLRPLALLGYPAWVAVTFLPARITGQPADFGLAEAALLFTTPGLARLVTWRDRTERWDGLDPLVIARAPVAVGSIVVVTVRLFEVGALSWN